MASDPEAGLSLEERPVFPQWAPEAGTETPAAENSGQETYWEPPLSMAAKGNLYRLDASNGKG